MRLANRPITDKLIHGIGASAGIIIGKAFLVDRSLVRPAQKRIGPGEVDKLAVKIAEAENISLVVSLAATEEELIEGLRKIEG